MAQPPKLLELAEKEHKASDEAAGKAGWRARGRAHLPASYRAGNAREMHNWIRATTEPSMKLMQKQRHTMEFCACVWVYAQAI